jgi:hypothetical protein
MAALVTEDAINLANTGPMYGRDAIEKYHLVASANALI